MGKGLFPINGSASAHASVTAFTLSSSGSKAPAPASATVSPSTSTHQPFVCPTLSPSELASLYTPDLYHCTLSKQLQQLAHTELREDEKTRTENLDQFRSWIKRVDYIKDCRLDANFLLRFLRVKKFNLCPAFDMLVGYILMRQKNPGWFHGLSLSDPKVSDLIDRGVVFALPERDDAGRRVIFTIGGNIDPRLHSSEDVMRTLMFVLETLLDADEQNQILGFAHILDESELRMAHLRLWRPMEIKRVLTTCEKSMPVRHKKLDFVSLPPLMQHLYDIASRLFISSKLRSRITFHRNRASLLNPASGLELHPSSLPAEYGGVVPLKDMIGAFKAELSAATSSLARVAALDRLRIDETLLKRTTSSSSPSLDLTSQDLDECEARILDLEGL